MTAPSTAASPRAGVRTSSAPATETVCPTTALWPTSSNQFRLLLHAGAYWLLDTLRRWLVAAGAERRQRDTLRLRLLKIGGRVREWVTQVRLHLASSHPSEPLWRLLATRPHRPVNNPG